LGLSFKDFFSLKSLDEGFHVVEVREDGDKDDQWDDKVVWAAVVLAVVVITVVVLAVVLLAVMASSSKDLDVLFHLAFLFVIGLFFVIRLLSEFVAREDAWWESLGIRNVVAFGFDGGRFAPGAGSSGIARFGISNRANVIWVHEVISSLFHLNWLLDLLNLLSEFVAREDAWWESLGIRNGVAFGFDSGRLAPGAGSSSIARFGISNGANVGGCVEELRELSLIHEFLLIEVLWESLGSSIVWLVMSVLSVLLNNFV
jgi:hypothetical protein